MRGGGTIGRHALRALTVHYAGAYTGYGPLVSGPDGLAYFTLRTVHETGSLTPSAHAAELRRGPRRQLHSDPVALASLAGLAARQAPAVDTLIPLQADQTAAVLYKLPPHARQTGLDPAGSAGHFDVVLAGTLVAGVCARGAWESVFVAADEPPFELLAGDAGVQLAGVQLPHMDPAYQ